MWGHWERLRLRPHSPWFNTPAQETEITNQPTFARVIFSHLLEERAGHSVVFLGSVRMLMAQRAALWPSQRNERPG